MKVGDLAKVLMSVTQIILAGMEYLGRVGGTNTLSSLVILRRERELNIGVRVKTRSVPPWM